MPNPRRLAPVAALALLLAPPPLAAHLPGAGPEMDAWFESLTAPDTSIPCCDRLDCHEVASRQGPAGWEAWHGGRWWPIPEEKIVTDTANPLEHAVLCWSPSLGMTCFVPPPAGFRRNRGS